jgi:glycosyltransferase involved in cell wall biosynthesis
MRILYLHQYYRTPEEGGGVRSYHVAHALAQAGHDVHVITTWQGACKRVQREGKLLVTSLPIAYDNAMPKAARIRAFLAFVWQSYREAKAWLPADRVFATSTPLTIGLVALLLKYGHGVPYIFEVRDCWPEAPIQLGAVKNGFYAWVLKQLERWIYKKADSVVTLSQPIADHVKGIVPKKQVVVVPNFADIPFFRPEVKQNSDLFHIVYAGTFGYANNMQRLLDLALASKDANLPVRFTLAGEGAEKAQAELFVQENGLSERVVLLPPSSSYAVRDLLKTANAAYVGFRSEAILQTNSPNKYFDALAAGVPILVATHGWLAAEVRHAGNGVVLADYPSDLEALKALLGQYGATLQRASQDLASKYDRGRLVRELVEQVGS